MAKTEPESHTEGAGPDPDTLPQVLLDHLYDGTLVLDGLRLRLQSELVSGDADADRPRVFMVGVRAGGIGAEGERTRLLFVGEGVRGEALRRLAKALEQANKDDLAHGVLPHYVDHWSLEGGDLLLTSDHRGTCRKLGSIESWRSLPLPEATEILIRLTSAMAWMHKQGLALGGVTWDQILVDAAQGLTALTWLRDILDVSNTTPKALHTQKRRDIASIARLLVEAATGAPFAAIAPVFDEVLDNAQVLVEAGLARPGLAQLLVGGLIEEDPFAYNNADDLLSSLLQLRIELSPSIRYQTAMLSTTGNFPLRRTDQDSCGYAEIQVVYHGTSRHMGFYCVADGVGGEEHGERASQASVFASIGAFHRAVSHYDYDTLRASPSTAARAIVKVAAQHLSILGEAEPDTNRGATTFTGVLIIDDRLGLAHVGDSRAYLLRDGQLIRLTRDHNLSNVKAALSAMTGEVPRGNQSDERRISRFLSTSAETPMAWIDAFDPALLGHVADLNAKAGTPTESTPFGLHSANGMAGDDKALEALLSSLTLKPGDKILLMSDGLYGELVDEEIRQILLRTGTPRAAVRKLLEGSMASLATDNITALVIEVGQEPPNLDLAP